MSLDPSKLVAVSYPKATQLCLQLNGGTISDDILCRAGWTGPVAVALGKMMHAGVACVEQLRQGQFCSSDAILVSAKIVSQGAR
jgi:hypothetical protein